MTDYSKMNIGELIDARKANNEQLADANKVVKGLKEVEDLIDFEIIKQLDAQGSTRSANKTGSVSINETEEPEVTDWDQVYDHILKSQDRGEFALLHRRISATAFRELQKAGMIPPGLTSRKVRSVNFRSLK